MHERLIAQLKRHEGYRAHPYRCSAGALTVGYGFNLDAGMTYGEADALLSIRVHAARLELFKALPQAISLSRPRQDVLVNMFYNLGHHRFIGFKKMMAAVIEQDWLTAADEMLNSQWAGQVGGRAVELAEQMRTGFYQRGE